MKRDVTRMFVRGALALAIAASGILASGCAVEQATKKTPEQLRAEEEARRKAEAEAKAKAEAEARAKAEAEAEARNLGRVYFDYDKYNVRDDQKATLDQAVDKLKARPEFKATVEGHCDERGTIEYNMALGQKRAESAQKYLVKAGIDAGRLKTISYGKERPASDGHDESAWSRNRRSELKVTEPSAP